MLRCSMPTRARERCLLSLGLNGTEFIDSIALTPRILLGLEIARYQKEVFLLSTAGLDPCGRRTVQVCFSAAREPNALFALVNYIEDEGGSPWLERVRCLVL